MILFSNHHCQSSLVSMRIIFREVASGNISYVSSILEWLRKHVLATGLDEGRGDSSLDFSTDH